MTLEQYKKQRESLLNKAQTMIDESNMDAFNAAEQEIKDLDEKFDNECTAMQNLKALRDNVTVPSLENMTATVAGGIVVDQIDTKSQPQKHDMHDSDEYKNAFMNYVLSGENIPKEFKNSDATTKTTDVGAVIPTTTLQKIVEKMEAIGMILPLVTKTNVPGGVTVPVSTLVPTAVWVAEGVGSDAQKETIGSVVFAYHKLRCPVSMTFEVANLAYSVFEQALVQNIAKAMVKAKENAIINGTGTNSPTGILTETATENFEIAATANITYADLIAIDAALPEEYAETAVWTMSRKTYLNQIVGLVDDNDRPIFAQTTGPDGKPEYYILGRRVVLAGTYIPTFAHSPSADTVFAFLFDYSDYMYNQAKTMGIKRYTDNATDSEVLVGIELGDGKAVRTDSLITVTKLAPES